MKEAHTASRTPRPVYIAFEGENDYRIGVRDVEHPISSQGHTILITWPRAATAETIFLSDLMIFSLRRNLLKANA